MTILIVCLKMLMIKWLNLFYAYFITIKKKQEVYEIPFIRQPATRDTAGWGEISGTRLAQ